MRDLHAEAERLAATDPYAAAFLQRPTAPARARAWVRRADEVEALIDETGRPPRQAGPTTPTAAERRAYSWLRYQRRRVTLSPFQLARLDAIPGFVLDPREERWDARLRELRAWIGFKGQPSRRSDDPSERRLALWATRQERAWQTGTMPYPRRSAWAALRDSSAGRNSQP